MPIKFRCAYCNQLMGIARRKAGTVVNCPTCNGQVVVPTPPPQVPPPELPPPVPEKPNSPKHNVFDRQDFDPVNFNTEPGAGSAVNPPTMPTPPSGEYDVQPLLTYREDGVAPPSLWT